ncbi:protein TraD [Neisseria gonorrhoeae]|uniref:Protein TraD n=1 Tax=Neisseria gonorrhoeae TaxID=485 RepID=A0A378VWQ7_NEIGO|nr:protein TraD [Neisseria gonorrhoeae]
MDQCSRILHHSGFSSTFARTSDNCLWQFSYFSLVSVKRALSALRIMRFRKNIRKLPYYALTADEIPSSDKALFLGKVLDGHRHIPNVFLWFASLRTTDFVTPQNSIRQRENMRLRQWVQTGFPA